MINHIEDLISPTINHNGDMISSYDDPNWLQSRSLLPKLFRWRNFQQIICVITQSLS
ncbi:hypothetical protein SLEP1_g2963 [Rubroshorea leprosula]|uniref:Cytochrome P450 n=1 Tax=Rubroshorea leprosula TaxID=152421 RepID=A0AAV5HU89_9ROSI|nr:hypothetical protein SLEP1_g2963 [Rubroshorea leprosula]